MELRAARPVRDLEATARFYCEGLGLRRLGAFEGHDGFDGLFVGPAEAAKRGAWHLEFTVERREDAPPLPVPHPEQLLVMYLGSAGAVEAASARLAAIGVQPVEPHNPYWRARGAPTFADPDGYRVVLFPSAAPV